MKHVKVEHTFAVGDEVTNDQIANLVGTMTVQVEEPVVGHTEDGLNELTIETTNITSGFVVLPTRTVWAVSWVYFNGDEQGGGGFDWTPDEDEARKHFAEEPAKWGEHAAIVRLTRLEVPDFGSDEKGRQEITDWIDFDIDMVEGKVEPVNVLWNFPNVEAQRVLLRDVMQRRLHGVDCAADESAEIKWYMRNWPDDGLTEELHRVFPTEWDEVGNEPVHYADLSPTSGTREKPTQCPEWSPNHGAWTTGDTLLVTCEACKRRVADDLAVSVGDVTGSDFLRQNFRFASTVSSHIERTEGDITEIVEAYAQHHAGGLIVMIRELAGTCDFHKGVHAWAPGNDCVDWKGERYVKMHDSWGDDGGIVVHSYYVMDEDESRASEDYFRDGDTALRFFLDFPEGDIPLTPIQILEKHLADVGPDHPEAPGLRRAIELMKEYAK